MTPQVIYPDALEIVRAYLAAQLPTVTTAHPEATGAVVDVREPNPFPSTPVVRIRLVGGADDGVVLDSPRIDLLVWHSQESKAHALARLCRALLRGLPGVHTAGDVTRVTTVSGPVSIYDDDRNRPRYLLTVELGTRGVSL